jgi:transposase
MVRPYSFIKLAPEQAKELDLFLRGGYSRYGLRARRRAQAVRFSQQGITITQIARWLKVSKRSIWNWLKTYQEKGLDGLRGKYFYHKL